MCSTQLLPNKPVPGLNSIRLIFPPWKTHVNTHINSNANMCKRNERVLRLNTNHDGCSLCVKMLGQFSSFWSQLISRGHTEKFGRHLSRKIDLYMSSYRPLQLHTMHSLTHIYAFAHMHTHTHMQIRDSTKHFSNQCDFCKVAKVVRGNPQTITVTGRMHGRLHYD